MRNTTRIVGAMAFIVPAILPMSACRGEAEPDAYGNFETTELIVSAETAGQLVLFTAGDGQRIDGGALVGVIDTAQLALEREEVLAQRYAGSSRSSEVSSEIDALLTQHEIADRNYQRTQRLHSEHAATTQQLDQAEREYRVLREQIAATRAQREAVRHEVASSTARIAQIEDRIRRSRITNPQEGIVLTSYVEEGEYVQPGQALYKLADMDEMEFRAYVTEPQLALIRVGQSAEITIDAGPDELQSVSGTVSWISSEAEFTPTPVQTREERADLVYAVKIVVPNPDGLIKIGMPGDVRFSPLAVAAR